MKSLKKITHTQLRKKLAQGETNFYFTKKDGTLRKATGTLVIDVIPYSQRPQGIKTPEKYIPYFDLEVGAWRSVSKTQEIWID